MKRVFLNSAGERERERERERRGEREEREREREINRYMLKKRGEGRKRER